MTRALQELQAELEFWNREAAGREASTHDVQSTLQRCADLQLECDLLATELVHVRMAVSGTGQEIVEHEQRTKVVEREVATA